MSAFREWLQTLADAEATVPARVVLERLGDRQTDPAPTPAPERVPDRLLTVKEAADMLGVSPRWVYRHDSLPFRRKLDGHLRFSQRGIERWLATRR